MRQGGFPARIADVGVVKDLGTHDIDLTAWLADSPFTRVAAETMTNSGREHEDMVVASGRLECGVITSHVVNWLSPVKIRQTVVTGELGAFVADTVHADLTFQANGSVRTRWDAVSAFRGVSEGDVTRLAIEKPEPCSHRSSTRAMCRGAPGRSLSPKLTSSTNTKRENV